jgi:hypothetical protein
MTFPELIEIARERLAQHKPSLNVKKQRPPAPHSASVCQRRNAYLSLITKAEVEGLVEAVLNAPELKNEIIIHEPPITFGSGQCHLSDRISHENVILEVIVYWDASSLSEALAVRCWYSKP